MKKLITAAAAALMLVTTGAKAIPVLDQENTGTAIDMVDGSSGTDRGRAQTFTVGVNGVLSTIEFLTGTGFSDRLDILSTFEGVPFGGGPLTPTVLGTVQTGVKQGNWLSYDVSALNISVTAGDVLAFKIWAGSAFNSGAYTGGGAYFFVTLPGVNTWLSSGDSDLIFRTYVEDGSAAPVPLPASGLLLGGVALAGLVRARKRMA